ncbi:MAG: enoyl-CoA hydratase/isomerase family protein [Acidimicrobiaceae bacterium]|jgi:2-(1,2-epoxy-1,2-dihydrophenyl)acetyl-CoA isomerase|nr:enoyl-CoA hydratase/isomerase family protein [Acidimicrobiaceae bacterium]
MSDDPTPQQSDIEQPDVEEQVRFEIRNQVAWITIDNPTKGNAISPDMRDRMASLVNGCNGRFEARAIVITAVGRKLFCPGADISVGREFAPRPDDAPPLAVGESRRMMLEGQLKLMPAILDSELPVIAAVNGTAAGVGAHLALCCDLVIMADTAKLIEVFARRGLVPDGLGAWILPRLVGLQKAKELMFFAEDISAEEALRIGLCNRVVPGDDLIEAATEWAERLASGPTRSFMLTKWLVNRSLDVDRRTLEDNEAWAVELNNGTLDSAEGLASFRERRDPVWRGF